jgi:hypothetical protein
MLGRRPTIAHRQGTYLRGRPHPDLNDALTLLQSRNSRGGHFEQLRQ